MFTKSKIENIKILLIFFLLIGFSYSTIKDIHIPGYQQLNYYDKKDNYYNALGDRVYERIPKRRYPRIVTQYNNKYLVEVKLSNTVIEHSNGFRVYTLN